jgi:hypothetical protein
VFALLITGYAGIGTLTVFGVVVSTLFAIAVPAAKAIIPNLVPQEALQEANGLVQTITWPAYFLGSGLLALIMELGVETSTLLVAGVLFGLSCLMLLAISPILNVKNKLNDGRSFLADFAQGYAEMRSDSVMLARIWAYGIFTFFWRGSLQILVPLAVLNHLHSPSWVLGMLMFVNGAAEFISNLVVGRLRLRKPLVFTFLCEVALGIGILMIALGFNLPVPEIGLFVGLLLIGVAAATIDIPLLTVIQTRVSSHNVGKVVSYWFTIGSVGGALGNLAFGLYYQAVPIVFGTLLLGIILFLAGLIMLAWAQAETSSSMSRT